MQQKRPTMQGKRPTKSVVLNVAKGTRWQNTRVLAIHIHQVGVLYVVKETYYVVKETYYVVKETYYVVKTTRVLAIHIHQAKDMIFSHTCIPKHTLPSYYVYTDLGFRVYGLRFRAIHVYQKTRCLAIRIYRVKHTLSPALADTIEQPACQCQRHLSSVL